MREVFNGHLWLGHAGDLLNVRVLESHGIVALIHVALEERIPEMSREMMCCHFPIRDGANTPATLTAALETTASLIRSAVPTLVCCSAGMSRTPSIAAGALALATGAEPTACLQPIIRDQPHDISTAMWDGVLACVRRLRHEQGDGRR